MLAATPVPQDGHGNAADTGADPEVLLPGGHGIRGRVSSDALHISTL